MSLLRAELRRLTKRRVTRWMLLLVVLLMPTIAVLVAVNHQRPGPAAVAEAQAQAAEEFRAQQQWIENDIAACERDQAAGNSDQGWPEDCEEIRNWATRQEDMVDWFMPPAFEFREQFPDMILVLTGLLAMLGFIVGASYVGAEWRTGGMMNLLLWRPRRLVVLGSKLAALAGGLAALTVLLGAVWTAAFWQVARLRGITDTMTSGAWQSFGLTGLRALALVLVAGTVGFALASVGRHTAAAMGAAIGAFVIGVVGIGIIVGALLQQPFVERYLWTTYLSAWITRSVVIEDFTSPCVTQPNGECLQPTFEITWQMAGIGMAGLVAVLVIAAMWQIRQRDVT